MENPDLQILFLKAVGAIEEDGLDGQFESLYLSWEKN